MKRKAFSITELLVVIVIIAIIALIAFPLLGSYLVRARISELYAASDLVKKKVSEQLAMGTSLSDVSFSAEDLANLSSSEYIDTIEVNDGIVTVKAASVLGVDDFSLTFTPTIDGEKNVDWECSVPLENAKYVGSGCSAVAASAPVGFDPRTELPAYGYNNVLENPANEEFLFTMLWLNLDLGIAGETGWLPTGSAPDGDFVSEYGFDFLNDFTLAHNSINCMILASQPSCPARDIYNGIHNFFLEFPTAREKMPALSKVSSYYADCNKTGNCDHDYSPAELGAEIIGGSHYYTCVKNGTAEPQCRTEADDYQANAKDYYDAKGYHLKLDL